MKQNRIHIYISLVSACILSILSGCTNATVDQTSKPAALINASTANTKIISQAMSQALNGRQIMLGENAFINSSQHTLEKKSFTGMNTNSVDGLILGIPVVHRFSMFTNNKNSCYLVYDKTGEQYSLKGIDCRTL